MMLQRSEMFIQKQSSTLVETNNDQDAAKAKTDSYLEDETNFLSAEPVPLPQTQQTIANSPYQFQP